MALLDLGRQGQHRLLAEWLADDLQTHGHSVGIEPARHRRDRQGKPFDPYINYQLAVPAEGAGDPARAKKLYRDQRYASYASPQPTSNTPAHFVQRMLRGPLGRGARA